VTDITLVADAISDPISVTFLNEGPGTWDANTVLAVWDGTTDGPPSDGSLLCHDGPHDWASCAPGVAAWIGYGPVGPGEQGTFEFQIQPAANTPSNSTLYFRLAEKVGDGYQWIGAQDADGLPGNRTYETFTLHTTPAASQPSPNTGLRSPSSTLLLIHGFNFKEKGSSVGWNCQFGSFDVLEHFMRGLHIADSRTEAISSWTGPMVTLQYYNGDTNCDDNLHKPVYSQPCESYEAGNDGTNQESLNHLSCLLAWMIWLDYSHKGSNVEIVAHSMGGLIVRNALYQVQQHKRFMPPGPLLVSDVVTIATPHGGVPSAQEGLGVLADIANFRICGDCQQFLQMNVFSTFMNQMADSAQSPQGGQGTDWTLIGQGGPDINGVTECDFADLQLNSPVYMDGAHKVIYETPCYDHGAYLGDQSDIPNASALVCEAVCKRPFAPTDDWEYNNAYPHALARVFEALFRSDY
jgi:hypothetical protein